MNLGQKIKKLRLENHLTVTQLADKLGVSHVHISKMERSLNKPSLDLLEKLAEIFEVDVTYFFKMVDNQDI